jgi:polyhydroxyalkanoate synthesis regulator phasin
MTSNDESPPGPGAPAREVPSSKPIDGDAERVYQRERDSARNELVGRTATMLFVLAIFLMGLAYIALSMRHKVDLRSLELQDRTVRESERAARESACREPASIAREKAAAASTEQPARILLERYIDRPPAGATTGNTYSLLLSGLEGAVKGLVDAGGMTAKAGSDLVHDLAKQASGTVLEIGKDAASAAIARHFDPLPVPKEDTGDRGSIQQVQVHVYDRDKRIAAAPVRATAKSSPRCPNPDATR